MIMIPATNAIVIKMFVIVPMVYLNNIKYLNPLVPYKGIKGNDLNNGRGFVGKSRIELTLFAASTGTSYTFKRGESKKWYTALEIVLIGLRPLMQNIIQSTSPSLPYIHPCLCNA